MSILSSFPGWEFILVWTGISIGHSFGVDIERRSVRWCWGFFLLLLAYNYGQSTGREEVVEEIRRAINRSEAAGYQEIGGSW